MERKRCTVHLSGPLSGCNPQQRRLWRDEFKRLCPDMQTIDPSEWADEWDFSRDLRAVAACDVVVANMWKESIGTTIEIMQARARGRPVVLIDPNHLDHTILRGLVAPEKPVNSVKEAAARVRVLVQELGGFRIVKKDGSSESFDRDKLMRGLKLACTEAGVDDQEFPNQILGPVVASLRRAAATRVVSTSDIKNAVFAQIDHLAAETEDRKAVGELAVHVRRAWEKQESRKQGDTYLDVLHDDNDDLRARVRELGSLVSQLHQQIADRDARLTELDRRPEMPVAPPPATLFEALRRVERDYAEAVTVHPRALKSAKDSPFQDVEKANTALRLLGRYARERLEATSTPGCRPLGAKEWFRQHREEAPWLGYAPHESKTSMTMWVTERTVGHAGEILLIEQHLRIGKGSPADLLRIHFAVHPGSGQVVIGHCGRHLTNTKS
jgi:ATP cone domain